jgi:hypothetical protein
VSFFAITLCVASQRMFVVSVYFVIDSVRKLLDTPSYIYKMHGQRSVLGNAYGQLAVICDKEIKRNL